MLRSTLIVLAILAIALAGAGYPVQAAGRASTGNWDGARVAKPSVLHDASGYKMWYDGADFFEKTRIGLATSSNGMTWTESPANPVLQGEPGEWDGTSGEHSPFVMKDGNLYKMWYEGSDGSVRQLGLATSSDGVTWTKYAGNPVLHAGPDGYDQVAAAHGSVLYDGGMYKLWYHAVGDQGAIIAYATSPDGINWTKAGPVLVPEEGSWDDGALWGPGVLKVGSVYWMWYSAGGGMYPPSIGAATSTNGVDWTRAADWPVVTGPGSDAIGDPHVISDGGIFKMWYVNFISGSIYYVHSADGINWSDPVLALAPPGDLDTGFSGDGKVATGFASGQPAVARGVAIPSNGRIVVAGDTVASATNSNIALARYTAPGALDTTFNLTGRRVVNLGGNDQGMALAIQAATGKVIVVGQKCAASWDPCDAAVLRLNSNGSLDTTFHGTGWRTDDFGGGNNGSLAVALQSGGRIVAAGSMFNKATGNSDFSILRYTVGGTLDTTFSGDGKQSVSFGAGRWDVARAIAVQPDGKIVVAGRSCAGSNAGCNFAIARLNSSGALDSTFNATGRQITDFGASETAFGLALQADGKIVLAGVKDTGATSYFALARYNTNGSLDKTFAGTGKRLTNFSGDGSPDYATAVRVRSDGRIVVCGDVFDGADSNFALLRYTGTGALDASFSGDGKTTVDFGQDDHCLALAFQGDGKYVLAGYSDNGILSKWVLARVLP
jgi:uncharacterized delta-60 repeat protein